MKISEAISRVRNIVKSVKEDAFLTDRFIYSLIKKYGYAVLQKEINIGGLRYSNLYTKLPYIELVDISTVEIPECFNVVIPTGCSIKRSKSRLPKTFSSSNGLMIRTVASLDYSKKYYFSHPEAFNHIMNISINKKWNKNGYFYIDSDDYLYIFNDDVKAVLVEGLFVDYTNFLSCDNKFQCQSATDFIAPFPDHLFAEIESYVLKELLMLIQIPSDNSDDSKSITR